MKSIEKYLDSDWILGIDKSNRLTIEEFEKKNKLLFVRIILSNDYLENEYTVKTYYGDYTITKKCLPKRNYYSYAKDAKSIEPFINLINSYIKKGEDKKVYKKNLSPHGDNLTWDVAQYLKYGSKIIIVHKKIYNLEKIIDENLPLPSDESIEKDIREVFEQEFGVNLARPYIRDSIILIQPHTDGRIKRWKVQTDSEHGEGIRCWLDFDEYLHPFPEFKLTCEFSGKNKTTFFNKSIQIHDDSKFVYNIFPPKSKQQEIYHVSVKMYRNGNLIDDLSGYPIRSIHINIDVKE